MEVLPPFFNLPGNGNATGMGMAGKMPDPAPTSLQIFALAIIFLFPALALVVVLTRVAGRFATKQFGWDDWLIAIAMFLSLAETVISYFFIKTNFVGIHSDQIPTDRDPTEALIWAYAVQILYNPILSLVKSSVLIFLLRLFGQKNGVRRFIIILNVINFGQMVGTLFAIIFQCTPIELNWEPSIKGQCVDRRILFIFTSAFNIMTDLIILGLPLYIFVDLKIPRRTKIALLFVFLLGFLVTIASVVRLAIFVQGLFGLATSDDPTFNIGFVTSAIETNLALITASAPALRPFFRSRERGGWFGRFSLAPSKAARDLESGEKSAGWPSDAANSPTSGNAGGGVGGKLGRGGSRGGSRGGRSGRGRGGAKKYDIRIRRTDSDAAQLRSQSPRSSEEETMTSNGIMRVSDIQREIDGIVKEISVSGAGTYTGIAPQPESRDGNRNWNQNQNQSQNQGRSRSNTTAATNTYNNKNAAKSARSLTNDYNNTTTQPSGSESNINNFRNTGFDFFDVNAKPPRPNEERYYYTGRENNRERYYSESVYPDLEYSSSNESRDYNEERISKYGEKRFGVVTPKGTTPTTSRWREEGGRPF